MEQKNLIETTLNIASLEFLSTYPEIHHYTKYDGLKGIIQNNTLWATHFTELNDSKEIVLLKEPLIKASVPRFQEVLKKRHKGNKVLRQEVEKRGGLEKTAKFLAKDFIELMYKTTFHDTFASTYCEPFITSFCFHGSAEEYEKKNGLLSQWRGYGGSGYCIVFDTNALAKLVKRESDVHFYTHIFIDKVNYATPDTTIPKLFPKLLDRCEFFVERCIDGDLSAIESDDGFAPFLNGAALYKHQGFKEEREVRIIAIPGSQKIEDMAKIEYPNENLGSIKTIHPRDLVTGHSRRLILFEGLNVTLPIKRIIVAPSKNQEELLSKAKELVGKEIEVIPSVTPFIG